MEALTKLGIDWRLLVAQLINFARYADRVAAIFSEAIHQEAKDSPPWDNISDIKDAKPK